MTSYKVNDIVVYGTHGVCRITEISERDMTGSRMEYYVLKPLYYDKSTIFIPAGNEELTSKMKPLLSAGEIAELIRTMPYETSPWIDDENERKARYREIMDCGDRQKLVRMVRALHLQRESLENKGKRLRYSDENMLKEAERVINEEFAHVLNIKREQVSSFIRERLQEAEGQ